MPTIRTFLFVAALTAAGASVSAQTVDPLWDGPERLSTLDGSVRDRGITIDSRDRSHAFWVEDRLFEGILRIQYARFGGKTWTPSVRIRELTEAFSGAISAVDAAIDSSDTIHLIWHGRSGPISYSTVAVDRALSPSAWSEPVQIPVSAEKSKLLVDVQGSLVIVYFPSANPEAPASNGVFSVRSTDRGATWSAPVQIDSAVPAGARVQDLDADYDGLSAIHAAWTYVTDSGYEVRAIKYARSIDAGTSWSAPSVVEAAPEDNRYGIRLAIPEVRASGANAHIIYAGGGENGIARRHLYSTDFGATWTSPETVWEGLGGAAGTDSAYFDSQGRLNLLAQVREPAGIYHAVWQDGQWPEPKLIYLIAQDAEDVIGNRVHAQWFEASVTQDDRVVLLIETCAAGCQDNSNWPANPIMFAMNSVTAPSVAPKFTTVSSATFVLDQPLAPAAIAAGFGPALSAKTTLAAELPLPTSLDDVEVEMGDALNQVNLAAIQFVSPKQINFVIPDSCAEGLARVRVRRGGEVIAAGTVMIGNVAPSIFTANGQGTGVAAATWLLVAKDGSRTSGLVFDPNTKGAVPVAFDAEAGDLYLTFYGTGIRGFAQGVRAEINERSAPVFSAGDQGQYDGLDQVNIGPLPAALAADGEAEVQLVADGVASNRVTVLFQKSR